MRLRGARGSPSGELSLGAVSPATKRLNKTAVLGNESGDVFAKIVWGIAAVYLCCATLRLARFQVETPSASIEDHRYFKGLPTPGAAGAVASLIVLGATRCRTNLMSWKDA